MQVPSPKDLLKKPLAEAIFEFHWSLQSDGPGGNLYDPAFQLLVGRFYDRVIKDYPAVVNLPASQAPDFMLPRTVRHQFRPDPNGWPLVQLGPGLLTVNETSGYTWPKFEAQANAALANLNDAYPTGMSTLKPCGLVLRYINRLEPVRDEGLLRFLRDKMHVNLTIDPTVFNSPEAADNVIDLHITASYPLEDVPGTVAITIATGQVNNQPALIWQLEARSHHANNNEPTTIDPHQWLSTAHKVIEKWFFSLSKGTLLESFD